MSARRNEVPLDLAIRFGQRVLERIRVTVDPDKADDVRGVLLDTIGRLHSGRDERHLGMYAVDAWRPGKDRNPRQPWRTFAFESKR